MSVEVKCDRCGGVVTADDDKHRLSTWDSIVFAKGCEIQMFDLCEKCKDDMDIFMTGGMLDKELRYVELRNPLVSIEDNRLADRYDLHISADLNLMKDCFETRNISTIPIIERVLVGMRTP